MNIYSYIAIFFAIVSVISIIFAVFFAIRTVHFTKKSRMEIQESLDILQENNRRMEKMRGESSRCSP